MQEKKWGICLDCETYNIGLFQKVVQYQEDDESDEVIIILPITAQVSKIPYPAPKRKFFAVSKVKCHRRFATLNNQMQQPNNRFYAV